MKPLAASKTGWEFVRTQVLGYLLDCFEDAVLQKTHEASDGDSVFGTPTGVFLFLHYVVFQDYSRLQDSATVYYSLWLINEV